MKMRNPPSISKITPGLFIGNAACTYDQSILQKNGITGVVSLVNGPLNLWRQPRFTELVAPDCHKWVECADSSTQDLLIHMADICNFIDQMLEPSQQQPGRVLVHCDQGISRSVTVVIAYLMRRQQKTPKDVLAEVHAKRPQIKPNKKFFWHSWRFGRLLGIKYGRMRRRRHHGSLIRLLGTSERQI